MMTKKKRVKVRTDPYVAKPHDADWRTVSDPLLLRRIALEKLGWRIHFEDGLPRRDRTHYVYWVGPNNEMNAMNAEWWTEGLYTSDPEFHWYPPNLGVEAMLAGYDYVLKHITQGGVRAYEYEITVSGLISGSVDINQEVAALSALLGVLAPPPPSEPVA